MALDLESMVSMLDEPLADPAPLNVLYISRLARQQGIKVLLSGAGGDDLFSGYRRHLALHYEGLWTWMPAPVRAGLSAGVRRLNAGASFGRRAQRVLSQADLQGDARLASYFTWTPESRLRSLYTPAFNSALGASRADQPMLDYLAGISERLPLLERMLALEQRFFLADHNLVYTDRMSMAAGVETRVPFLDLDLVELASRIPHRFKQRGRIGKWVLKKVMEPWLPRDVIYRPKTGFGAPLRSWLRGPLRPMLHELLGSRSLRARGLFEPAAVSNEITAFESTRIDNAYTLLSLMCIELWCRRFLDPAPLRSERPIAA
jgi:asparagine synthase (glutamine-hydrolysing)